MASPLGHLLAGLALGRAFDDSSGRGALALSIGCVALALAPDLDFLPGLLQGQPALYHQGPSHSLVVGLALSLGAALLIGRGRRQLLRTWLLLFAAFGSHLAIDSLGPDRRPPIGMPLLWPFCDTTWLAPVGYPADCRRRGAHRGHRSLHHRATTGGGGTLRGMGGCPGGTRAGGTP